MKQEVFIVAYHDISSEKDPLTSQLLLSTRPEMFRQHLTYFNKNYDLIDVDELLSGKLPRRPLLLTFDDAYRSVLSTAGPILKDFNAPSVFFIIASAVRGDWLAIDNVLSLAVEEMGLPRVLRLMSLPGMAVSSVSEIISRFVAGMRPSEIAVLKARIFFALGTTEAAVRQMSKEFLDLTDLDELKNYRIEVGNHSMTHSHFRTLSRDELDIEIRQSRRELQRLSGQKVRCLSIPYGDEQDATENALAFAEGGGHQAIFLVHARSNRFRRRDNAYYRVSLRNERPEKLALALRILPILRSLRHAFAG
jgi:peptidoglycan/xylan/chitin deacetylase (PgdA/CDA1 family)